LLATWFRWLAKALQKSQEKSKTIEQTQNIIVTH